MSDGYASIPRTRGGDPYGEMLIHADMKVFPAHAGVIPSTPTTYFLFGSIPRTRGGDPSTVISK